MQFELKGLPQLEARLKRLAQGVADWSPCYPEMIAYVQGTTAQRFQAGPGWWPRLSAKYGRRIERHHARQGSRGQKYLGQVQQKYPGTKLPATLIRSGRLFTSLTTGTTGSVVRRTPTQLIYGTNVKSKKGYPYPVALQRGAPSINLPKRPFLYISQKDIRALKAVQRRYVERLIKA